MSGMQSFSEEYCFYDKILSNLVREWESVSQRKNGKQLSKDEIISLRKEAKELSKDCKLLVQYSRYVLSVVHC